jgi:class 3 adenylate cyclase
LQLGVGLHTGRAGLGNIGSSRRMEYTAIGDTVNLASRLEGTTKQFGVDVVMSGSTREAVGERVASSPLGSIQVKGKSLFVEVFAVEAIREVV